MSCPASRRRLLFVIPSLESGGAEGHLARLLPALADRGWRPAVCTFLGRGRLAAGLEARGIPVFSPPGIEACRHWPGGLARLWRWGAGSLHFLYRALVWRPVLLHFFLPLAYLAGGLLSLAAGSRVRVMSRRSLNLYQLKHPWAARVERWLHGRMDAVLGNSLAVVEQLREEGVAEARLGLIHNGLELPPAREAATRGLARRRLGLPEEALLMVVVANLLPYKGHADLLRALARVTGELPAGWRLYCLGEERGWGEPLRTLARELGLAERVWWMGGVADVALWLGACDLALLCSHEEGFSNALLEAMAAGLPVVATAVGGNGEAVEDGVSGLLTPPRDPVGLGEAIMRLAGDAALRERLGGAARLRVEERFSLEGCVARYDQLYGRLCGGE